MPISAPTHAAPDTGNFVPNISGYDLEECFTNLKNECISSETPAYWIAGYFYVCLLSIAFFLNIFVMLLFIRGIREFRKMIFYWLAFQLLTANILYSIGHFINRDTLAIFAKASRYDKAFLADPYNTLHSISKCIINFYTQILPFGTISLALHRFGIFVLKEDRISERHFMMVVTDVIYLLIIPITVLLTTSDCLYHFESRFDDPKAAILGTALGVFHFKCGSSGSTTAIDSWIQTIFEVEQIVIPCIDLLLYLIIIVHLIVTNGFRLSQKASFILLIPPFTLFVIIEASNLTSTFILTTPRSINSALMAKRIINIVDMIAASLVPVIIFATNKEVRRVMPCFRKKRRVVPNLLFLPPSPNLGSPPRARRSEVMSPAGGDQHQSNGV